MKEIEAYLFKGQYNDLEVFLKKMEKSKSFHNIKESFLKIAYETESISTYAFSIYMYQKSKQEEWLELAIDLLIHSLSFIEGAYSTALFHARELLEVHRSVENLELILFFYIIPERLVDKKQAIEIAREILRIEPENAAAKEVLDSNNCLK